MKNMNIQKSKVALGLRWLQVSSPLSNLPRAFTLKSLPTPITIIAKKDNQISLPWFLCAHTLLYINIHSEITSPLSLCCLPVYSAHLKCWCTQQLMELWLCLCVQKFPSRPATFSSAENGQRLPHSQLLRCQQKTLSWWVAPGFHSQLVGASWCPLWPAVQNNTSPFSTNSFFLAHPRCNSLFFPPQIFSSKVRVH